MELYHELKDDAYILILSGALDENNTGEIDLALKKAIKSEKQKIVVDCGQLNYISSAGIGIFLSNLPFITDKGKKLEFTQINSNVLNVFQVLGLDHLVLFNN